LSTPDGFTFHNKARPVGTIECTKDTKETETEKKGNNPHKKKIRSNLEQSESPEDSNDMDE
jgi:hypothetical protein